MSATLQPNAGIVTQAERSPVEFTVVGGQQETLFESVKEIWRFRPLIWELVRRELKVRYKNRVGGIVWSLFPPLMRALTIAVTVKLFVIKMDNYSAYLLPVLFLWQYFMGTVMDAGNSVMLNAPLARKIYFPRAILPLVAFITNLLHFIIAFAFIIIYLFAIGTYRDPAHIHEHLQPHFALVVPITLMVGVLGLGIGLLLAGIHTLYEDARFLTGEFLGLAFYLMPVFYIIERVKAHPQFYDLYMLNPMAAFVVGLQRCMLAPLHFSVDGKSFSVGVPYEHLAIASVASLVMLIIGFAIFERTKWRVMERL